MHKYKILITIFVTFVIFLFLNFSYYLINNWRSFLPKKSSGSPSGQSINLTNYNNSKLGFELKHLPNWVIKENETTVEVNPPDAKNKVYFSVSLRNEFSSLAEVKGKLSSTVQTTPFQVGTAEGFKYKDTDDHDVVWISNENKLYSIRVYYPSRDANNILATLKFI